MVVDVANDIFKPKEYAVAKLTAATDAEQILLHELQLGEKLSESVHQARRADFSLMLAMLSDDVREQSQFILPKQETDDSSTVDVDNNKTLRKYFNLPHQAPIALDTLKQINQYNQMQLLIDDDISSLHLSNALSPKPLAFRDDCKFITNEIMTNTSEICQVKYGQGNVSPTRNKRLNMNVKGWLNVIQTSLVKSTLVEPITA